jgi:hypothetical protein
VPTYAVETAERARTRLLAAGLPSVLGYADFEAQNLRWKGRELWAAHDWDSLAWQPEAALVGAASGAFARDAGPPSLAPIESSGRSSLLARRIEADPSPMPSWRSRGRPACGRPHTTPGGRHCTETTQCRAMRFADKQPNASAERTPKAT